MPQAHFGEIELFSGPCCRAVLQSSSATCSFYLVCVAGLCHRVARREVFSGSHAAGLCFRFAQRIIFAPWRFAWKSSTPATYGGFMSASVLPHFLGKCTISNSCVCLWNMRNRELGFRPCEQFPTKNPEGLPKDPPKLLPKSFPSTLIHALAFQRPYRSCSKQQKM